MKKERVAVTNLRKPGEPHAITAALSTGDDRAFVTYNGVNAKLEVDSPSVCASLSRRSSQERASEGGPIFISASIRTTAGNGRESCRKLREQRHHHLLGLRLE